MLTGWEDDLETGASQRLTMLKTTPIAAVLACGAMLTGCAADTLTEDQPPADNRPVQDDALPDVFTVRVDRSMTAETIAAALLASAHDQVASACEAAPDKAVRVFNPLASGAYADFPCSTLLATDEPAGSASKALARRESDGPIARAQQEVGPISFLMCGLFLGERRCFSTRFCAPVR